MRKVLNLAHYPITAKLGGNFYRFKGRETKNLPVNLVMSDEFKEYSTLKDAGVYQAETPVVEEEIEIKSSDAEATIPETPVQEQAEVLIVGEAEAVDDKQTEVETVEDAGVEEKPKPKRKRKAKTTK